MERRSPATAVIADAASSRLTSVLDRVLADPSQEAPRKQPTQKLIAEGGGLRRTQALGKPLFRDQKVIVVMPAYNAQETLRKTFEEVSSQPFVDEVIVVDDASSDRTTAIAEELGAEVATHPQNLGYGGNQKTCYRMALQSDADIVIMVHPDYQYTPRLIPAMVSLIGGGLYDCVLGSRILGGGALRGGMPLYKYIANRFLTLAQNLALGAKVSEYHTGYRAFSRRLLESLPLDANSDDFVFDNQMLTQIHWFQYTIAEVSCPTAYFPEASSINFPRSVKYGLGCLLTSAEFVVARLGLRNARRFPRPRPGGPPRVAISIDQN